MNAAHHEMSWTTNTTPAQIATKLRNANSVLLLTHAKPDGDAAGSTLALAHILLELGIRVRVWFVGPLPNWLADIAGPIEYQEIQAGSSIQPTDTDADVIVIQDTGSWPQLREVEPLLRANIDNAIVLDHHLQGDSHVASTKLIDTTAAATTMVTARLCCELANVSDPSELSLSVAKHLFLGLATDTGWFRHSNVSAAALRLAAQLREAGVDHTQLYQVIEQHDNPARFRLMAIALGSLELYENDTIALMHLTLNDFEKAGASRHDTGGIVDMLQSIASVQVSGLITEADETVGPAPTCKVSLRSKPGPHAIDVNAICISLGGGGHARAAGAKVLGKTIEQTRSLLLETLAPIIHHS